jgi:hypothetical protein
MKTTLTTLLLICLFIGSKAQSTLYSDKGFIMQDTTIIAEFEYYTEIGITKDIKAITIRDIYEQKTFFTDMVNNIYSLDETLIETRIDAVRGGVDYGIIINFELYYFMIKNLKTKLSYVYYLNN